MAQVKTFIGNIKGKDGKDGAGLDIYDTAEQVCGQWIDGKPIYRKVVEITSPNCTTDGTYAYSDVALNNVKNVCKIEGLIKYSDSQFYMIPITLSSNANYRLDCYYANGKVCVRNSAKAYSGKTINIIIEYTKTTD